MKNKQLFTIFIIVFIDLLGFGLILPLLPYYAETFGATPTVVGLLVASYAAAQLLGAPILGRLSDKYGRRPILLVSIFGTVMGFLLLGVAKTLIILFISRVLDGLTGGNISVAQAYITDITDEKNRAKGLGMIGAAFGLGFIIGPAAGGALSVYGYAVPAFVAAALATLNLIAVFLWLPESLTAAKRAEIAKRARRAPFSLSALWTALNRPRVGPLFNIRFFFGLAFAIFQTVFALYAQYRFNLSAAQTGFVLTYVGVLSVIVQGGAIGWLSKKFDEKTLIFTSTILMAIGLFGWAVAPTIPVLLIIMIPTALGGGTLNTVLNSSLTKAVYPEEVGGTLGLSASLESATRVIAPSIGGFLLGQISTSAPGFFATAIMLGVIVFTWRRIVANPDPPLPARSAAVGKASA